MTTDTVENELVGPRQRIIAVLYAHGEPVSTSVLRQELNGDIDVLYHLRVLRESGIAEKVGKVRTGSAGRGQQAQSHRLTEEGQDKAADVFSGKESQTIADLADKIASHDARISEHHDHFETLEQRVSDIEEQIERQDQTLQQIRSFLERQGAL
jgi:peptidoglycan hydrolase CwlO-like protein